jgi:uncharacterized protein YbjT (DUF2867 family)
MILVTGAAGTVGSEVVKELKARAASFKVGYRNRRPPGVEGVAIDLDKPETLGPALRNVETVFLLSTAVAPERNLVAAAKVAGVKRVVKLSVWGAAEEGFVFARWHRAVEREIEGSGLAWTFLRPNGFMQNVVNFMGATIKSQGAFYHSAADARISHVDARDIGAVAARTLTDAGHEGKAYALSGPESLSYSEIAAILSKSLGREIRYVAISDVDYKQGAMAAGIPEPYADALIDLSRHYRTGQMSQVTRDVTAVSGRDPIHFEQFARDYAAALR